jgi:predicted dehydrogenase
MQENRSGRAGKMRVAFLGGAYASAVGRVHRTAVEMDQRFELVAGCFSRHAEANRDAALRYGLDPACIHGSLDELLGRQVGRIDAIVILTPTDQHAPQVLRCLDAGLPVICEKALASNGDEVATIRDRLLRHSGFLAVTYNYTGYPMFRELKRMVAEGRLGRIEQIHVEMPQDGFGRVGGDGAPLVPQDWRLRDGRVPTISLDLGVHLHMMVRFLTAAQPLEVVATSASYGNFRQVVDNVSCLAHYSDDLNCCIWYSKTAFGYRNGLKVRVFGENGAAEWLQENPEYLQLTDRRGTKFIIDRASGEVRVANQDRYSRFKVGHPSGFIEAFANYYYDAADALTAHLAGDNSWSSPYVFGVDEALQGTRMLEAIADSSARRCWVPVETT